MNIRFKPYEHTLTLAKSLHTIFSGFRSETWDQAWNRGLRPETKNLGLGSKTWDQDFFLVSDLRPKFWDLRPNFVFWEFLVSDLRPKNQIFSVLVSDQRFERKNILNSQTWDLNSEKNYTWIIKFILIFCLFWRRLNWRVLEKYFMKKASWEML